MSAIEPVANESRLADGEPGILSIVHIVDDEEPVCDATALLLEIAGYRTFQWRSGDEFLAGADLAEQAWVLLDMRMPGQDGLSVLDQLRATTLEPVVVTGHGDVSTAVEAIKRGAVDFLEKPYDEDALLDILRAGPQKARAEPAPVSATWLTGLTDRERQVLAGLMRGGLNKTIAAELNLSTRTVEFYRANLMEKLGAQTVSDAVRIAFDGGFRP